MQEKIKADLKQAMLSHNQTAVSTLRLLLSELKYVEVEHGKELEESEIIDVIQKEIKKRREAAAGFRKGGREEQATKEESELEILQNYMPSQLSDEELTKIVEEAINRLGASSMQDMGRVINDVLPKVGQLAEGSRISLMVKEKLKN